MPSPLDFNSTERFRKVLMARNLPPYPKSPYKFVPPLNYETIQRDLAVVDTPDKYIDQIIFAAELYVLNQYGTEGGYQFTREFGLANTKSNQGEYGLDDVKVQADSIDNLRDAKVINYYSNGDEYLDAGEFISSLEVVHKDKRTSPNGQPYPNFVFSMYNPLSILLSNNPSGSDGNVSQDSFLMQIAVKNLKKEFEERIAREVKQRTIDKANFLNLNDGLDFYNIMTGAQPLVSPDWSITKPANPVTAAADLALKLGGSTLPFSPIPGSYFDPDITLNQLSGSQRFKNNIRKLMGGNNSGSEIMFNNMGEGQKSALFFNLKFNRYRPNLDTKFFERIFGENEERTINGVNYYVGSPSSDPAFIQSPSGQVPLNEFGDETSAPVYGPDLMGKLYEGEDKDFKFGLNGRNYVDGGAVEGGFSWTSTKYKDNAGKTVGVGGRVYGQDESYNPSSFNSGESTNQDFEPGSILDDIQSLINSQPAGAKRFQHAGNAIDQVSKIFNDGYKEITKGSKVLRYEGEIGNEVGMEYCRLFTKDTPYLNYGDLQKTDGITKSGRRFGYSVLDNTYNLNIYPVKPEGNQDSTNIIVNQATRNVKKYMFSLENLSWRTSNMPGYTVSDLPVCERGPNDGRIMWFPPYGLKFNESVSTAWQENEFLGRPERVYTYRNTNRTGSLEFKIVVDHPSVLNIIVNKVLANESNKERINGIITSFFAGCLKYDIYELAKKYNTASPNDLKVLQNIIEQKTNVEEVVTYINQTLTTGNNTPNNTDTPVAANTYLDTQFKSYEDLGFYFNNDIPRPDNILEYGTHYNNYVSQSVKDTYNVYSTDSLLPYPTSAAQTSEFFSRVVENNFSALNKMFSEIASILENDKNATVSFSLLGSASQPQTEDYNRKLGSRRIESVKKWLNTFNGGVLTKYLGNRLLITNEIPVGESTMTIPKSYGTTGKTYSEYDCTLGYNQVFTINAMACRATKIRDIVVKRTAEPIIDPTPQEPAVRVVTQKTTNEQVERQIETLPKNITKKILRLLLSECDYFQAIKEETPMVYDNLKDKLKYFDPAFHSTTPEGLNSRLTFLQQCMRPGDTIPTVVKNGTLEYNNARNTAFGAPPILVLRIGDFYHTKIIPDSLTINFEDLDLNPEGIGVQPMIANVQMGFKFIGGQGLKNAIDKLQNSLSFNYYANTEVYDDRSDVTDESLRVIDTEFYEMLKLQTAPPAPVEPIGVLGSDNTSLIGKIVSGDYESGVISYTSFMDSMITNTQDYFVTVFNTLKTLDDYYNPAIRQLFTNELLYRNGYMRGFGLTNLFGKPTNYESKIIVIFDDLINDIENDNESFVKQLKTKFSNKLLRVVKTNYKNYLTNLKSSFTNEMTMYQQKIVDTQLNFYKSLTRLNILSAGNPDGTDGFKNSMGKIILYGLSGMTVQNGGQTVNTYNVLSGDSQTIVNDINAYYDKYFSEFQFGFNGKNYSTTVVIDDSKLSDYVFEQLSLDNYMSLLSNKRVYALLSKDIIDSKKYSLFKESLIGNVLTTQKDLLRDSEYDLSFEFDEYWDKIAKPAFVIETALSRQMLDQFEKRVLSSYYDYKPFDKGKNRDFTYNKISSNILLDNLILSLGYTANVDNDKKSWNKESVDNPYVTKVKLL